MSILDPAAGPTLGLALAIAFAVLLAGWLRERRVGQTASWRKVALAVVAGSLLILIIQPSTQRTVDRQTAWVLTPGATREAAEDKGLVLDESILSVALTGTEPWSSSTAKAPDLATFLRSNPQVEHLQVLGGGLEPWDVEDLRPSVSLLDSVERPRGIVSVGWRRSLKLGQWLRVTGSFVGVAQGSVALTLEGPDGSETTTQIDGTGDRLPFTLEVKPPGLGRFLYRLVARTSDGAVSATEVVDVQVSEPVLPTILWLEDAPSFETKFTKRWLIDQGNPLAIRSRVSRDRYHQEFHGLEISSVGRLAPDLLEPFDLVIVDHRAWARLSETERSLLIEACQETGLGILMRMDPDRADGSDREWALGFVGSRIAGIDRLVVRADSSSVPPTAPLEIAPFELSLLPAMTPQFTDTTGRILAMSRPMGKGTVGVTLLRNTYPWVLEGQEEAQHSYWRRLINALARRVSKPEIEMRPGPILLNEPLDLTLRWSPDTDAVPALWLRSPAEPESRVAMRQNPMSSSLWEARIWPSTVGWHQLIGEGARLDFYVGPEGSWLGWQGQRRRRATLLAALHPQESREPVAHRVDAPIPRLPFYVALLISLALLWLDERRGSQQPTTVRR